MSKLQQAHDDLRAAEHRRQVAVDNFYMSPCLHTRVVHEHARRVAEECAAEYRKQLELRRERLRGWRAAVLFVGGTVGYVYAIYYLTH